MLNRSLFTPKALYLKATLGQSQPTVPRQVRLVPAYIMCRFDEGDVANEVSAENVRDANEFTGVRWT